MGEDKILFNSGALDGVSEKAWKLKNNTEPRININSDNADSALAKLVLTLIELIRKLVEKQAIQRVEGGSLTEEEIERLGETLMKLELKMAEMKDYFNLKDEDLNINLGPLGNLM